MLKTQCLINGNWLPAANGKTIAVNDPASATLVAHVPMLDLVETKAAIASAGGAVVDWKAPIPSSAWPPIFTQAL